MTDFICAFPNCRNHEHVARGYCGSHYGQWHRGEELKALTRPVPGSLRRYVEARVHTDECTLDWPFTNNRYGRPMVTVDKKQKLAVHYAWFLKYGVWPTQLNHIICHNSECWNPNHTYDGSHDQNMLDRRIAGRTARGQQVGTSKLTDDQVRAIRNRYSAGGLSRKELAADYGVTPTMIGYILQGRSWRHV